MPARSTDRRWFPSLAGSLGWLMALAAFASPAIGSPSTPRNGGVRMPSASPGSLLIGYYEAFLRDQDIDAFRRGVSGRYHGATLARILHSGDLPSRRAAVLALGLFGDFASNAAVARALRDADPTVRALADNALWAIWYRADTPENNEALGKVRELIGRGRLAEAIDGADRIIARSPDFAEARNQKAIALFFGGRMAESAAECREVVARNPYHTGALSGMGQCLLRLGRRDEATAAFRQALEIQPYNDGLRELIAELEAGND